MRATTDEAVQKEFQDMLRFVGDRFSGRIAEVAELTAAGASVEEILNTLGLKDRRNIQKARRDARLRAAHMGYSPYADETGTAPPGYTVKGKSTFYDENGTPIRQWVKTEQDRDAQLKAYVEAVENAANGIKPIKPLPTPKRCNTDLLTLYHFTDYHLGMYAWAAETGEDWDTTIAKRTFATALAEMIENAPDSEVGIFSQGGDFCHWDGWDALTPMNKHLLDADTRFPLLAETAIDLHIHAIEELLKKHKRVVVIVQEGNHDMASSVWIRKAMKAYFAKNKRVEIDDTEAPFYSHQHGNFLLGFHHGHKVRNKELPRLFASDPRFRETWGKCEYAYIHCGHYHKTDEWGDEYAGAIVERHPTLAARDAYATRGGYVSKRAANAITYHKERGELMRYKVTPPKS